MTIDMKEKLLFTAFPKFIWICEISTIELYKSKMVNGMVILDATGFLDDSSIIFYYHNERLFDKKDNSSEYCFKDKNGLSLINIKTILKVNGIISLIIKIGQKLWKIFGMILSLNSERMKK